MSSSSTIDPKILAKIKKCLALSSSDNPHEAAAAMRQARALMDQHGVASHDVAMSEIGEATVESRTMARDKPVRWEIRLAGVVGQAFGCQMMLQRRIYNQKELGHANEGAYVYVGLKQQAEVASYTATVLIRKCKAARQKWLSDNFAGLGKTGIPGVKRKLTRMGDAFAEGWVASIAKLVADFANPPEVEAAIAKHIEDNTSGNAAPAREISKKDIGQHEQLAAVAGMRAAKGEHLYRPMHGQTAPLAIAASAD